MKRIYLLRHAKAEQTGKDSTEDRDRPLTEFGRESCKLIGEYLKTHHPAIDTVMCSDSVRTKETLSLVLQSIEQEIPTAFLSSLYLAGADAICSKIQTLDNHLHSIMVVGHNPGLQQLASTLVSKGDTTKIQKMCTSFPPAALVIFDVDAKEWAEVAPRSAVLLDFVTPKDL